MAVLEIVTVGNAVLRETAEPVTPTNTPDLQQLIDDMIETMRHAQGVGLAAPQIGRAVRLAVVETPPEQDEQGNELPETRELFVLINPVIVWSSLRQVKGVEGCLSIPGYLGEVERSQAVHVQATDRHGRRYRLRLSSWDARIFQHEIDHLDGVLYTDKLTDPANYWTEEAYAARSQNGAHEDHESL